MFAEQNGARMINVGVLPYGANGADETERWTINKFLEYSQNLTHQQSLRAKTDVQSGRWDEVHDLEPVLYAFDRPAPGTWPALYDAAEKLIAKYIAPLPKSLHLRHMSPQFFVGPAGAGAPMHWHVSALNLLFFGFKKW